MDDEILCYDEPCGGLRLAELENQKLLRALKEMVDTVIWMSGSSDFGPEGQAYWGWIKVRPKLDNALELLKDGGENVTSISDDS